MVLTATTRSAFLYIDFLDCDLEFATAKLPYCQLDQITVHDGQFITLICLCQLLWNWFDLFLVEKMKYLLRDLKVYSFLTFEITIFFQPIQTGPFSNSSVLYQGCCLNDVTTLQSSGPNLLLRFVSDSTVNGRGFYLKFYTNETATGRCWQFNWKCLLEIFNKHVMLYRYGPCKFIDFFSIHNLCCLGNVWVFFRKYLSFHLLYNCSPDSSQLTSESAIIIIIVITIVCLSCVGVLLPLLYFKHKYPNSKFSNKILPRLHLPKTLKASEKLEQDNLRKNTAGATTSGSKPPDLLESCYGQTNAGTSNSNGSVSKASDKRLR